jgi:hypothetical protein
MLNELLKVFIILVILFGLVTIAKINILMFSKKKSVDWFNTAFYVISFCMVVVGMLTTMKLGLIAIAFVVMEYTFTYLWRRFIQEQG